jgi:hypothetical protein
MATFSAALGPDDETGSLGLVDGLVAVALIGFAAVVLSSVAARSSSSHYGALQTERRIEAANAIVDLQAIGAYDRAPFATIYAAQGTAAAAYPLPAMTPFPGAQTVLGVPPPPTLQIAAQDYDDTSGRLVGTIDMPPSGAEPALHIPVALAQATSGQADCPQALAGVAGSAC